MDELLNNRRSEILWRLLANPADNGHAYSEELKQLADDYPQSGLLQALYARSAGGSSVSRASASFDPKTLYVLMNAYENLAEVPESQIVQVLGHQANGQTVDTVAPNEPVDHPNVVVGDDETEEVHSIDLQFKEPVDQAQIPEEPVAEHQEPVTAEMPGDDHRTEIHGHVYEEDVIGAPESADRHQEHDVAEIPAEDGRTELHLSPYEEEIMELPQNDEEMPVIAEDAASEELAPEPLIEIPVEDHKADTPLPVFEEEATAEASEFEEEEHPVIEQRIELHDIEDDIFDEIVGIESINIPRFNKPVPIIEPLIAASPEELEAKEIVDELPRETPTAEIPVKEEFEELIPESLAVSDYFLFERSEKIEPFTDIPQEDNRAELFTPVFEEEQQAPGLAEIQLVKELPAAEPEAKRVSKYHDEKMPYTFMWWLDKTRKEHSGIYQPFKLDTSQAIRHTGDETLQQQYYENIFHLNTVEELEKGMPEAPVDFELKNREDHIIKKFIEEDPHIGTPSGDKLDNENKAKRSAEDQDELVSETLAKVYIDQMLYHKAINTYKKLMLKFPEKSRYFADQIELLERKIN